MLILPARADQPKPPIRTGRPSRPTSPRALLLSSLSIALLVACGDTPKPIEYRLDNILPSPVTPGETVTAFGLLPDNATLTLDGLPLTGSSVPDGLSFKVPNSTTAGDHLIRLDAGETHLEASLSIKPRVDSVSLDGTILRLSGAGWGNGPSTGSGTGAGGQGALAANLSNDTRVLIDGLEYAPSIETNPNGSATGATTGSTNGVTPSSNETNPSPVMRISLPERLPYGSFSVIVRVGDRSSAPLIVSREAGSITGTVSLPATSLANTISPAGGSGLRQQSTGLPVSKVDALSVIVQFNSTFDQQQWVSRTAQLGTDFQAALAASLETESLPSLRVSRLRFASAGQAQALVEQLGRVALASSLGVTKVSLDLRVKPSDAFRALNVPAPTDPSLTEPGTTPITNPAALTRLEPGQGQWFLNLEGIPNAWNAGLPANNGTTTPNSNPGSTNTGGIGSGSPARGDGIVVAVIDTGVDLEHPDLKANLLPGWDFIDDDPTAQDIAGHGTHVAGLIAANGLVKGVAPNAKLLPVRVLRDLSGGTAFPVAQGILWAAGLLETPMVPKNPNPARVINLSLGSDEYNDLIAAAISSAIQAGVTVIAAAGNNGGSLAYPAALPGVVAVTALAGPRIAYQPFYASRGSGLWVTAYGGDVTQDQDGNRVMDGVLSTDLKAGIDGAPGTSGYGLRMGTSMASPQVAGLAALALSSGTPNFLLRSALSSNTSDIGPLGFDARFGHGLISGRIATPGAPRAYVLAFTGTPQRVAGSSQLAPKLLGWALVQPDGSYQLNNLPTGSGLKLIAATDANANGLLGEAGEFVSGGQAVVPVMGKVTGLSLSLELQPSSGLEVLRLQ